MSNWKEICEKCVAGEIEPDCEYYGEPNGCNSPTYLQHPPVCNVAAVREAAENVLANLEEIGSVGDGRVHVADLVRLGNAKSKLRSVLTEPARNCDEAEKWLDLYCHFHPPKGMREMPPEWVDAISAFCQWVLAVAEKERGDESPRTGQESEVRG